MKNNPNPNQPQHQSQQHNDRHANPENKDNLDSRKNLELNDDPSGHNKKEVHNGEKNEHNETRGAEPKQ